MLSTVQPARGRDAVCFGSASAWQHALLMGKKRASAAPGEGGVFNPPPSPSRRGTVIPPSARARCRSLQREQGSSPRGRTSGRGCRKLYNTVLYNAPCRQGSERCGGERDPEVNSLTWQTSPKPPPYPHSHADTNPRAYAHLRPHTQIASYTPSSKPDHGSRCRSESPHSLNFSGRLPPPGAHAGGKHVPCEA